MNHLQSGDPALLRDGLPIRLEFVHFVLDFLVANFLIFLYFHDLLLKLLRKMWVRTVADLGSELFAACFILMKFVLTDHSRVSSDLGGL